MGIDELYMHDRYACISYRKNGEVEKVGGAFVHLVDRFEEALSYYDRPKLPSFNDVVVDRLKGKVVWWR